ncbi:MAG: hypothetical protein IJ358_01745 [Clostridia bacterium]|nr:hypothetical protein [Clostridia bacterium]
MQLYLYSSQDLILRGKTQTTLLAGRICCIKFEVDEIVMVYPKHTSGVMIITKETLLQQQHSQINFYKLSESALLCEIKPFIVQENIKQYLIKGANLKLIENLTTSYIYFNGTYYGNIKGKYISAKFQKIDKNNIEYGVLELELDKKYVILFDNKQIIYCGQNIDSEINKQYIQIYSHLPNIFNVGKLAKYEFETKTITNKSVIDKGDERRQINFEFNIIYFLEAIKCDRLKYAHSKLSYELKSVIDIKTLEEYFKGFDNYIYLYEQDAYIALKNNKVIGVYHFVVKDNLIDNIY